MGRLSGMSFARNDALPNLTYQNTIAHPRGQFFPSHIERNLATVLYLIYLRKRRISTMIFRNTIFGDANVWTNTCFPRSREESGERGPLSNAVVKDTQELRQERASNWKTSFSTFSLSLSPLSSCFTLVASTHERFMGRVKDTRPVHRQFYNEITEEESLLHA